MCLYLSMFKNFRFLCITPGQDSCFMHIKKGISRLRYYHHISVYKK